MFMPSLIMFNWWFIFAGIPAVEILGYFFHKFLDHGYIRSVPILKNIPLIERIEYEHWKHHFKHYTPDKLRPEHSYHKVQAIEWKIFGPFFLLLLFLLVPFRLAVPISVGSVSYAIVVWYFHRLFHIPRHFLSRNKYFIYLRKIHDLHHLDTTSNFTITIPAMDFLMGTFTNNVLERRNTFHDFEERFKKELQQINS